MATTILKSSRDWLIVGLVASAAFLFFTAGAALLARMGGAFALPGAAALIVRLLASVAVAALLLVAERRGVRSIDIAALDGLRVAAVIIIASNLAGGSEIGLALTVRTAFMLLGLPTLAVLTHLLARRAPGTTMPQTS